MRGLWRAGQKCVGAEGRQILRLPSQHGASLAAGRSDLAAAQGWHIPHLLKYSTLAYKTPLDGKQPATRDIIDRIKASDFPNGAGLTNYRRHRPCYSSEGFKI